LYYGYFQASIKDDLYKVGVDDQQLGPLEIAILPFSLKLLWAPLVDTYYINRLGRRKTYLLIGLGLVAIFTIGVSFIMNELISHARVAYLGLIGFGMSLILSFSDISADAWVVNYVQPSNTPYAGMVKMMGRILINYISFLGQQYGIMVSYNIYIGSEHLTCSDLFKFMGGGILILCLYIAVRIEEINTRQCQWRCKPLKKNLNRFGQVFTYQSYT
jgi:hypothetical protein